MARPQRKIDVEHAPAARRSRWRWVAVAVVALAVVVWGLARGIDEPLRRRLEANANASLQGYTVTLGGLRFHPLGLSIDFLDLRIVQDSHPDPPVLVVPRLHASVHWSALLHRKLVADFLLDRPAAHLDLAQAEAEARDETPVEDRGWQDAVLALYPLKVNVLRIRDGSITYRDRGQFKPLELTDLQVRAGNIRNVVSAKRSYPSTLRLDARLLRTARLGIRGHANFLAEPFAGVRAAVHLARLPLEYLDPLARHLDVVLRAGTLSTDGVVEYAPWITRADLHDVRLDGAVVDVVQRPEDHRAAAAAKSAKAASGDPHEFFRARRVRITNSTFGVQVPVTDPPYRLFVSDTDLAVDGLSNHGSEGTGVVRAAGRFMGSGRTSLAARIRPTRGSPDLTLDLKIRDTDMRAMNDLWRATGAFDVTRGRFSLYTQLAVRRGRIEGYVKPFFRDVVVYDPDQDRDDSFGHRLYERFVGGAAWALENHSESSIATRTPISGPLEDPRTSTWQVIVRLVQNAFFKAILPGLERQRRSER